METDGKDFSTPERRAGLERSLDDIVGTISDSKIADYYRQDFRDRVYENFKKRTPAPRQSSGYQPSRQDSRPGGRFSGKGPFKAPLETVSPAVKASLLARGGKSAARVVKEGGLGALILAWPDIAVRNGEMLAALPFSDRQLDRLRHEILHLAASGSGLERKGVENHLVRQGLADLVARLTGQIAGSGPDASGGAEFEEMETRFLRAAADLREMAELAPERTRAVERFNLEPSEENWDEVIRGRSGT
jgi:DNA primase